MQRLEFIVIVVASLFILSGCVPFPTKNIDTPRITGNIHSGGSGLENYSIFVAYGIRDACKRIVYGEANGVASNASGDFILEPTYEWSPVRWAVPLDGLANLSICIVAPDGLRKWAYVSHIRTPAWAPDIVLSCDYDELLSEPIKIDQIEMYEPSRGCKRVQS